MRRLEMWMAKQVLRLRAHGLSGRETARSPGISRGTVGNYLRRADEAGTSWSQAEGMTEEALERSLFPPPEPGSPGGADGGGCRPVPDWSEVSWELRRKGVTRRLLWLEYRERHPHGYGYSRFCDLHREWEGRSRTTMRQVHRAGERVFVDYAGMTMPVTCPETGEVRQAQIFVATLGASSYTFVEAAWSQKSDDFLCSYVRLFEALGGVPDQVVPDNLKAGVSSPGFYEPTLNRSYGDLLDHYGTTAVPARAGKPRDKAKVETAVRHVERRVLAPLRNRVFFSLAELNAALAALAADLNVSVSRHLGASRLDLLERLDRPSLRPLPSHRWELSRWERCRAGMDYHVPLGGVRCSVPCGLAGRRLWARRTQRVVEFFHNGVRVASREAVEGSPSGPARHSTIPNHLPAHHRYREELSEERLLRRASKIGAGTRRFVEAVFNDGRHRELAARTCSGTLRLSDRYGAARLDDASVRAVSIRGLCYSSVQSILRCGLDRQALPCGESEPASIPHRNIRGASYFCGGPEGC